MKISRLQLARPPIVTRRPAIGQRARVAVLFTLGLTATAGRSPEFREIQRQGVLYLGSLPEDQFPAIRAVAPVIGRRSLDQQFELALDVVVEGIAARLT
jgi:hypothetical protein